jgi:hypothetical protein
MKTPVNGMRLANLNHFCLSIKPIWSAGTRLKLGFLAVAHTPHIAAGPNAADAIRPALQQHA